MKNFVPKGTYGFLSSPLDYLMSPYEARCGTRTWTIANPTKRSLANLYI